MALSTGNDAMHALQDRWSLWHFRPTNGKDWNECQQFAAAVGTIEEFWSLLEHVKYPSRLKDGCEYSFFKYGIRPTWEDEANKNGGKWTLNLDKRMKAKELDNKWTDLLIALIGDEFDEYTDEICGVVIAIRPKSNKLSIWTKSKDSLEVNDVIGKMFKKVINLKAPSMLYLSHESSAKR